jgi:NAD(P)-dependent dehydrogenase (short-subunit alcohol dehydrogenase family)
MPDVAIVTGGTGSIGAAICQILGAQGWSCLAADLVEPEAGASGSDFEHLDVRSYASIRHVIDRACSLGTLRALVNAHGILRETPLSQEAEDAIDAVLETNLKGVARVLNAAAGVIADRGAVINLSSVTASMGRTQNAYAYQAAKAGVEALTRTFAIALAPREVRVNCVAPGYLSTPMRDTGAELRTRQGGNAALERFTPFGRLVTPWEVAEVVAFLCSSRASGISGVVLPVDGGQRAY